MFAAPLQLDGLPLANRVLLAPLAGVTDVPFRRICQRFGAGLTYVEMLSANALLCGSRQTHDMLARHGSETVLGVQLTGKTVEEVVKAGLFLEKEGFDTLDINMGCPVRKVVGSGMGAAFLCDPERISETMAALKASLRIPVTMKTRVGFESDVITVADTARRAVDAKVVMLTLHGRTRSCTYADPIRYDAMAEGFRIVRELRPETVLCGNGNVMDVASGRRMVEATGCDAVMVSRGALGNPWLFKELVEETPCVPTLAEWREVVEQHLVWHREHYGDHVHAARRMRKHLIWYAHGFPHCAKLRLRLNTVDCFADAESALREYVGRFPPDLRRYEDGGASRTDAAKDEPKLAMDRALDRGVGEDGLGG
ncbi:MAG TPA: tRNA-dihydrouridine synthase [Kiritimatiellia bacterium]|nr:tRNA-dihydrouridine synthase [Kiritimatiellia bacterium]